MAILLFYPTNIPESTTVLESHLYHFCGQNTRARATMVTFQTHEYHQLELVYPTQIYGNRLHHTTFLVNGIHTERLVQTGISVGSHGNPDTVILQWSHFVDNTDVDEIHETENATQ
jgi:hypothetical protein